MWAYSGSNRNTSALLAKNRVSDGPVSTLIILHRPAFGYNHYKNDYKNEGDSHESIVSDTAKTASNNMTLAHAGSIDVG
jgi:hypothetical protein